MSMNLNARNKKGKIELWQTPTQISYTILPSGNASGGEALAALERYKMWVKHSIRGVYDSEEELKYKRETIKAHLSYLEKVSKNGLVLWIM